MTLRFSRLLALLFLSLLWLPGAAAQDSAETSAQSEVGRSFAAAIQAAAHGPADVALRDLATIRLSDPYSFIPAAEAAVFLQALGNTTNDSFLGLIIPKQEPFWFVTIYYTDSGYVSDEDAKDWNADELLQSLKDGNDIANKVRAERGITALDVVGWVERPAYDGTTHRLVWSILAKDRGTTDTTINYNTYALGRQGYFELNLVTGEDAIAQDKKHAGVLLSALDYRPGERYSDYNASTDRVAEFGLAALIGGVAAKKLGLLAVIGVALAKFWKVILIAVALGGGGLMKLFRRKPPQA